jgi:hypothetical protein
MAFISEFGCTYSAEKACYWLRRASMSLVESTAEDYLAQTLLILHNYYEEISPNQFNTN